MVIIPEITFKLPMPAESNSLTHSKGNKIGQQNTKCTPNPLENCYSTVKCPWGFWSFVCRENKENSLLALYLWQKNRSETENIVRKSYPNAQFTRNLLPELQEYLIQYAQGNLIPLSITVDLSGFSSFARKVLSQCAKIPLGQTITYGQLAKQAGHPQAARAAGTVMAKNPIPIIIPCHRVVKSNGKAGSYSASSANLSGTAAKEFLLQHEKKVIGNKNEFLGQGQL